MFSGIVNTLEYAIPLSTLHSLAGGSEKCIGHNKGENNMRILLGVLIISLNTVGCGEEEGGKKTVNPYDGPNQFCYAECYTNTEPENKLTRLYARLRFLDRLKLTGPITNAYIQIDEKGVGEGEFNEYLEIQVDMTDYQRGDSRYDTVQKYEPGYGLNTLNICDVGVPYYDSNREEFGIVSDYQPNGRALYANIILPDYRSQYRLSFWIDVDGDEKLSDGDFIQKESKIFYHNASAPSEFDFEMIEYKEERLDQDIELSVETAQALDQLPVESMVLVYLQNEVSEWIQLEIPLVEVLNAKGKIKIEKSDIDIDSFKIVIDLNENHREDESDWSSDWTSLSQTAVLEQI